MTDITLTQSEADALLELEKHCIDDNIYNFPAMSDNLIIFLQSSDKKEFFTLDIARGKIDLAKCKYQNRARQVVILARLDLGNQPHRNPDGEDIPSHHIHYYREGFGDKWAKRLPPEYFSDSDDLMIKLEEFYKYCNITRPPNIERGLLV